MKKLKILDARNMLPSIFPFSDVTRHIESGGMIIYPTETVYGLGGMPEESVISKIIALKQRRSNKPMLLLVPDRKSTEALVWTPEASMLADAFWPGPLTLILSDNDYRYPQSVRNSNGGVAVRVSSHPVADALVKQLGHPILSTSLNMAGDKPLLDLNEMTKQSGLVLDDNLLVLDIGPLGYSLPSTVVDCSQGTPSIIREGAISLTEIERVMLK